MTCRRRTGALAATAALLLGCEAAGEGGGPPRGMEPLFEDATAAAGVDFTHLAGATGRFHFWEIMGAGVALLDYDRDGDQDLYLVQGGLGPGGPEGDPGGPGDRLYRNELHLDARGRPVLRFTDVTASAGVHAPEYGMGVAVGDVDNDGWPDLYLANAGRNRLLRNLGDGRFAAAERAGGAQDPRWNASATFFDYDGDGWLDLFVTAYVDYGPATYRECRSLTGERDYCKPQDFPPVADRLFHNRGDGTFEDVSGPAGIAGIAAPSLGVVAEDLDDDGRADFYVAADGAPNTLWIGRRDGTFEDRAVAAGCAVNAAGEAEAGMGVAVGDADGDLDLDLLVTHLALETNTLYRRDGPRMFTDATAGSGLGAPSWPYTGFGTAWLDVDGDGRLDLLVVNGGVERFPTLAALGNPRPFHMPNQLFRNLGGGRFVADDALAGEAFRRPSVSRGLATGDLDGDGDADLVVTENGGRARVLLRRDGPAGCRSALRLHDRWGRDGAGSRVMAALPGGRRLVRRMAVDGSYLSSSAPEVAVASGECAGTFTVRWPSGRSSRVPAPPHGTAVAWEPAALREAGHVRQVDDGS